MIATFSCRFTCARPAGFLVLILGITASLAGCASRSTTEGEQVDSGVYAFWPQFPAAPRMQFVASYQFSDDVEPPASQLEEIIYGKERQVLPINKPYGVEMADGKIYVCDIGNAALVILDLRKHETRVLGLSGSGRFMSPTDVAIAADGLVYVSDAAKGVIQVFNAQEQHVGTFGYEGFKPTGIAVHGDEMYVAEFTSQQVVILDRFTGEKKRAIGGPGDEDGQFVRPLGVAVDGAGNVYVTDVIRCRVQKFSPEGNLLLAFGTIGDSVGSFVRPKMIDVDQDGIIYVVDAAFANVQMFNAAGELLMFFGIAGPHPGSMKLPAGMAVANSGLDLFEDRVHPAFKAERLVAVTNQFGTNKVSIYALGQLREGKTPQDILPVQAEMRSGLNPGVQIDPLTGLPATRDMSPDQAPENQPVDEDGDGIN